MMDDNEITRTIWYMQGEIRKRYAQSYYVNELVEEVPIAVMNTVQRVDTSYPRYRCYVYRGVMNHITNYHDKYFFYRYSKSGLGIKPATTVENVSRSGVSIFDKMTDNPNVEYQQILKVRLEMELKKLTKRQRQIIEMVAQDMSLREIGYKLGFTHQTVSLDYIAARFKLSKALSEYKGNRSSYGVCESCGGECAKMMYFCKKCRAEKRRETLKNTAVKKKEWYKQRKQVSA